MVLHVKLFLKQFNHLMLRQLEQIVVIDGQMHIIIIVIDRNIKVIQDIHLIGKKRFANKQILYLFIFLSKIFLVDIQKNMEKGRVLL